MQDIIDVTMDGEFDPDEAHPSVLAITEGESPEDAFGNAVVEMAILAKKLRAEDDWEDSRKHTLRDFAADALLMLPSPVICIILSLALMELAEQTVDAEHAAEPIPLSEHPSNQPHLHYRYRYTDIGYDSFLWHETYDAAVAAAGTDHPFEIVAEMSDANLPKAEAITPQPGYPHATGEPVSSVLLPIGAYVRVDTTKPTAEGGMEPETYIGIIRGYDLGRTKYNVGARFHAWGEFKFGDGGWWCFLSEAAEITREEAHAK